MISQLSDQEIWSLIGFIKISPHRMQTLKVLKDNYLMPSEIARLTDMRTTQASSALTDLKKKNLVVCLNETAHKGRIYKNTELGMEILDIIENKKFNREL